MFYVWFFIFHFFSFFIVVLSDLHRSSLKDSNSHPRHRVLGKKKTGHLVSISISNFHNSISSFHFLFTFFFFFFSLHLLLTYFFIFSFFSMDPLKYIGTSLRIKMVDGRLVDGVLTVMDAFGNLLLSDVWESSKDKLNETRVHRRELGLVSVPKQRIVQIMQKQSGAHVNWVEKRGNKQQVKSDKWQCHSHILHIWQNKAFQLGSVGLESSSKYWVEKLLKYWVGKVLSIEMENSWSTELENLTSMWSMLWIGAVTWTDRSSWIHYSTFFQLILFHLIGIFLAIALFHSLGSSVDTAPSGQSSLSTGHRHALKNAILVILSFPACNCHFQLSLPYPTSLLFTWR